MNQDPPPDANSSAGNSWTTITLQPLDFLPAATYVSHGPAPGGVEVRVVFRGRKLILLAFEVQVDDRARPGSCVSVLVDPSGAVSVQLGDTG